MALVQDAPRITYQAQRASHHPGLLDMTINAILQGRAGAKCELCSAEQALTAYQVPHSPAQDDDHSAALCATCLGQLAQPDTTVVNHWRCLGDSMWSQVPAVQVLAWRQLKYLAGQGEVWAQDLLDMIYMEEETRSWAEAGISAEDDDSVATVDSNGAVLVEGDAVTLIKDLEVKGGGFTAKRGTLVKGIRLTNNPLHIEGKVNGVQIVLVAAYLKKA
jgi:protein PhnA